MKVRNESDLGEKLEIVKLKKNLTNAELGDIAGVSGQAISDIITGKTKKPNTSIFVNISQKLGFDLDWLLSKGKEMKENSKSDAEVNEPDGKYLSKDQEISSLKSKIALLEKDVESLTNQLKRADDEVATLKKILFK